MIFIRCLHSWTRFKQHVEMVLQYETEQLHMKLKGDKDMFVEHDILVMRQRGKNSPIYWIDVIHMKHVLPLSYKTRIEIEIVPVCGTIVALRQVTLAEAVLLVKRFIEEHGCRTNEVTYP